MGDMSDLPDFEKIRRLRLMKMLAMAAALLFGLVAWSMAAGLPDGVDVSLRYPSGTKALMDQPFPYVLEVVNDNDMTVEFEIQVAFYAKSADCVGAGSVLKNSFSLPQNFSVVPGSKRKINTDVVISESCRIEEAVPKIFVTYKRDGKRSGTTLIAPSISAL
jgi:hypothetical protein